MGMNVGISEYALAIVTTDKNVKNGGGCPILYAEDNKELQHKAMLMAKCVGGMVHDMTNGTLIIVKH
ncbi:MAG: capping complex subunit for YIEGIA [Romboutsia sp.]|uniref:capping complex subunit for YIEGIA n=1 Tax=Romboutsia sp. TaxID=1965302 RepID=UPI003F362DC4